MKTTLDKKSTIYNLMKRIDSSFDAEGEQLAIIKCNKVIEFFKINCKYPSQNSSNKNELKLSIWFTKMRQTKQGKGNRNRWYPILDKMANDAGIPLLFDIIDKEQYAITKCNEVITFIKHNNRKPSSKSTDLCERNLGVWLGSIKKTVNGKGSYTIYPKLIEMINKYGYPDLFDNIDKEKYAITKCNEVITFIKKNNRIPNQHVINIYEQKLGRWICSIKKSKKGYGSYTWHPILDQMVIKAGMPDLFNNIDKETYAIDRCNEVIKFITQKGKPPTSKSKNPREQKLGSWILSLRASTKRKGNTWYPILGKKVKKAGYPNLFNDKWRDDFAK